MMHRLIAAAALLGVAGCVVATPTATRRTVIEAPTSADMRRFETVVARVEPVAEEMCRSRRQGANCDYRIVVAEDPRLAPNAYQELEKGGRPRITFTRSLIAEARNADELAFILGHEAAHHIRGHIDRATTQAYTGAAVGGILAAVLGADGSMVQQAANIGGFVNARRYSVDYELEADRLGTRITERAGYDAVRGAQYFNRIPDPGNGLLASHPPNDRRIEEVERVAAGR